LRSHYIAAFHAAPLMIAGGRGLIVHAGHYGAVSYHQGPVYGAQKAGADKMAADMARELRLHHVAAVSIWMGGLDTERVRTHADALPPETRDVRRESTEFTVRNNWRTAQLRTIRRRNPVYGLSISGWKETPRASPSGDDIGPGEILPVSHRSAAHQCSRPSAECR
jgi:NAD(P)-dependent dehydrogenase (short-subunit alcohol dehydrogenase family)